MIPQHFKGAASELTAALHYINKGWQVYFPVCQQGQVDFVTQSPEGLVRVQVKSATWNKSHPNASNAYLQCRTSQVHKEHGIPQHHCYDLLVIVGEGEIWEIPSSLIDSTNLSLKVISGKPTRWDAFRVTV